MRMIMTIINVADVPVGKHLSQASVEPFFATRWSHVSKESATRIYISPYFLQLFLPSVISYLYFHRSWLITWFAHDVKKINDIARIYDAILCSHPLYSFYLCAAVSRSSDVSTIMSSKLLFFYFKRNDEILAFFFSSATYLFYTNLQLCLHIDGYQR